MRPGNLLLPLLFLVSAPLAAPAHSRHELLADQAISAPLSGASFADHELEPEAHRELLRKAGREVARKAPDVSKPKTTAAPAEALLKVLGLSDGVIQGAHRIAEQDLPLGGHLLRVELGEKDPRGGSLAILRNELGPTAFLDLLYSAEGRLIAIFPVVPAITDFWQQLKYRYIDLRPYYAAPTDPSDIPWEMISALWRQDQDLFDAYLNTVQPDVRIGPLVECPYLRITAEPVTAKIHFDFFGPMHRPRSDPAKFQAILPILPTVYAPTEVGTQSTDLPYHLSVFAAQSPVLLAPFLEQLQLGPKDSLLVGGYGNGIDTWLASLTVEGPIDVFDKNAIAIDAIRAAAAVNGLRLRGKVHNNIVDESGRPVFKRRYTRVIWNMPAFQVPDVHDHLSPPKLSDDWDGDSYGRVLRQFAEGLPKILEPGGRALVWNFAYFVDGKEPGEKIDSVAEILKTSGFSVTHYDNVPQGYFGRRSDLYVIEAPPTSTPKSHLLTAA